MSRTNDEIQITYRYWQNMMVGAYFIKGIRDSATKEAVLASNHDNYFGPDVCYWAKIDELPYGTYYIDGEVNEMEAQ
jgi:hypothetical protein